MKPKKTMNSMRRTITLIIAFALMVGTSAQHAEEKDAVQQRDVSADQFVKETEQAEQQDINRKAPAQPSEWTIEATYEIPQNASGLAWDGTYLYCGIYGVDGERIYRIDPATGDYTLHFNAPIEDAYGLTYDGTHFWSVSQEGSSSDPAQAIQFDDEGNEISQFLLQAHYMSGIAYDGGDFWTAAYYDPDGHLYKTDDEGNVLNDFAAPDNQPWDLAVEGDNLWMADTWGNAIYQIDKTTGELLATFASEHEGPSGITWDGQYLWYIDEGQGSNSWLYKVNLSGSGSPVINIPVTSYSYGLVNVGQQETWNMTVQNTGVAELTIEGLELNHPELSTSESFPVYLAPDEEVDIPVTYAPEDFGALAHTITVLSNDPLNGEQEVSLSGNGVFDGPKAHFSATSHNYGVIREKASERWFLEIANHGDEMLEITGLELFHSDFYTMDVSEIPIDIPVLGDTEIGVWFHPQGLDAYSATMLVSSNDDDNSPVAVELNGEGEPAPENMGADLWHHYITEGYDNSVKAFAYIPDINEDGRYEIIAASEDNYIRCLNGNADDASDILWETGIYSGNLYGQNSMVRTGDLNGDEMDDIVVGTTGGDRSVRAISGADGSMFWKFETDMYGSGGWVYQVSAKFDYNDDGVPDVLAAVGDDSDDTGPKRVFCLNGLNGDLIWDTYTGGTAFSVIGVDDFDGDGVPDVIAGATNESESEGKVWGLSGADGSSVWSFTTSGTSVWALERLSDITGDGIADIIAGDFSGYYYLVDATDGTIVEQGSAGSSLILRFENAGDLNGDTYHDIAMARSGTMMSVIDGLTGDFVWSVPLEDQPWNVRVMNDVDDDNIKDIAVGTLYQNNYVYILSGADGSEVMKKAFSEPVDGLGVVPDVTGDLSYEIIAGGREGTIRCFSGGTLLVTQAPAIVQASRMKHQAAPNPFYNSLEISFELPNPQEAVIQVQSVKGEVLKILQNRSFEAGSHKVRWNGKDASGREVPAGVYIYTIRTASKSVSGKLIKQ